MKRKFDEKLINEKRNEIYNTIIDPKLSHEQRVTQLAREAENMLSVLDEPEDLDELMRCKDEDRCICNLFEGDAPYRPRYICVDFKKFLENGSEFLSLKPPKDFYEVLNSLLILYHNIPSITNYPVYIGDLDTLLEPYIENLSDEEVKKFLKLWFLQIDRTILDSFCHADVGPKDTRISRLIFEVESELTDAVPNITMRVSEDTTDDFLISGIKCSLKTAKPSFANDKMFREELSNEYCIASCYNGLIKGGGAYTLCRLILKNIAKKSKNIEDFKLNKLPHVMDVMAKYMDERIRFIVEDAKFFEHNFLSREGLIDRKKFTAMFGLVSLAECVNILLEKENINARFSKDEVADKLGVEIMEIIKNFNDNHTGKYLEATNGHFLLHAQVGLSTDVGISPGTRIPIGEEPTELVDHLNNINLYHKYFVSGTGDIFPIDMTVNNNPEYVLDIIKGALKKQIRYLSFYASDSDCIRVTGYLVKKSEMKKLDSGENVRQNTTGLGLDASKNGKILDRRIR